MPTNLNAFNCKKYVKGTGLISCEPFFGEIKSVLIAPLNWSFPVTEDFDIDYILSKIQDGTFVPFFNTVQFTENTGDPTRIDYTSGGRRTIRNANPDYTLEFDNGISFHTAAYSYNGYKGVVLNVDGLGNIQLSRNTAGNTLYGFAADDINTRTYRQQSGDTRPGTMLDIHFEDPEDFNRNMTLISSDEIGGNINKELNGIISVDLKVVSASVANGVVVDVIAGSNSTFGIQALGNGNLEVLNETTNVVSVVGTVEASGSVIGRYTLTGPALVVGNIIRVRTAGFGLNSATLIEDTTQLYKGESVKPGTTVIA